MVLMYKATLITITSLQVIIFILLSYLGYTLQNINAKVVPMIENVQHELLVVNIKLDKYLSPIEDLPVWEEEDETDHSDCTHP